jgi:hypothetical protein
MGLAVNPVKSLTTDPVTVPVLGLVTGSGCSAEGTSS